MKITMTTIKFLDGIKTYILVVLLLITNLLHFWLKVIDNETATYIYGALIPLIAYTIRAGMKSESDKVIAAVKEEVKSVKKFPQ